MADIVLINPRFEISYWGMEHALPFLGKRANLPVACLPLLAALTPGEHTVTLIDENVEAIDFERCARADIVGVTGMSVQRFRMKEILAELKRRGVLHRRRRPAGSRSRKTTSSDLADVDLHRRGRGDLAAVPRRVEAGAAPGPLRAGREDRHDEGADAAVRPAQDAALRLRQPPVLARLPVPVRVLRHHRHLRPPAADQDQRPDHRRARGAARARGCGSSSSSTTT